MEVQEAPPPAGALGAEPLSLMPQHFPCEQRFAGSRALVANQGVFDSLSSPDGKLSGGRETTGDIGEPWPSDIHCEPGVHAVGFDSLAQQGSAR